MLASSLSSKTLIIFLSEIALAYIFSYFLVMKYTNTIIYITLSFLFSLVTILSIIQSAEEQSVSLLLFSTIVLSLMARSIFTLSTGLNTIPLSDSYADFAYANFVYNTAKAPIIQGVARIEAVSQWPLLHILTAVLSLLTRIKLIYFASSIIPLVFQVLSLSLFYISTKLLLSHRREYNNINVILLQGIALVIFAFFPHVIYQGIQFIRGNFGMIWIHLLLYLMLKHFYSGSIGKTSMAVLSLCLTAFVFSHHYSVGAFTIFMLSMLIMSWIQRLDRRMFSKKFMIRISVLLLISIGIWWSYYALKSFYYASMRLSYFLAPLTYQYTRQFERSAILSELRPIEILILVLYRDMVIYGLVGISCIIILFRYMRARYTVRRISTGEIILSMMIFCFLADFVIVSVLTGGADKCIAFYAPVLIGAFSYLSPQTPYLNSRKGINVVLVSLLIAGVGTFLAPYSHNYAPIYLYDCSVKHETTNSHNPRYYCVSFFLNKLVPNPVHYISDDNDLLYALIMPHKLQLICDYQVCKYAYMCKHSLIIRFGSYSIHSDFWHYCDTHIEKVYSAGLPEIYIDRQ